MNTSKSKAKAQLSSIVGIDGKGSEKASAGSSPVVVTPHKMKFNGTVNPIDYASAISWRRVNIGDPVFRELAASKLDPGARLPTDATSLLNMALSTFGPLDLEFILSELGATVFPQTQNERVVAAVKLISNRKTSNRMIRSAG